MKGFGWHEGDRSEYLALFAFSTIGYCSSVPRQYDHFGVDFFAHLARWNQELKSLVATGRAVCGQVKSDTNPVLLEGDEQLACLYDPSLACFHIVINKKSHSMQIYSMANRIHAYWEGWTGRVWVVPAAAVPAKKPKNAVDGDRYLCLGKPIYEKSLSRLEDEKEKLQEREILLSLIERWAWWEQIHLAFKEAGTPLYTKFKNYETNELPDIDYDNLDHKYYPRLDVFQGFCRGIRTHIDVLRSTIASIQELGDADVGVPNFQAWAETVKNRITAFLEASELPPPAE